MGRAQVQGSGHGLIRPGGGHDGTRSRHPTSLVTAHSIYSCALRQLSFVDAVISINQASAACSQGLFQPGCCVLLPPAVAAVQLTKQPTNNGAWLPLPLQTSSEAAAPPKLQRWQQFFLALGQQQQQQSGGV